MEILPLKIRQRYFIGLVITFILVVPLLVLYASGYRISSDLHIIKTGGINVEVSLSGASFYLDDEFEGTGSLFQKSFFIQNLLPDIYTVRIDREGFHDWRKEVQVYPQLITSGKALLLPQEIELSLIELVIEDPVLGDTKNKEILNPEYARLLQFFSATSTGVNALPFGATTTIIYNNATTTVRDSGDIGLWKDSRGLHAWWLGNEDRSPYFFCELSLCTEEIIVIDDSSTIGHFDFFPDENQFIVIEWPEGVFVTELDTRPPQNIQPLYVTPGSTFRVIDGDIFILDGKKLFLVTL